MPARKPAAKPSQGAKAKQPAQAAQKKGKAFPARKAGKAAPSLAAQVESALAWLRSHGSEQGRKGMARYAIPSDKAFGVSMKDMQALGKRLGRNHELAQALWDTGWHEARMVTAFVGEPERLTAAQMDRWCRELDNWAICDTLCFFLFDRTPLAWGRIEPWSRRKGELEKRTAFALLASLAGHDRSATDEQFAEGLRLVERAAPDERNFVKKGVSWALRRIGRRNRALHAAALAVAKRLADSAEPGARWVGKDALRDLTRPAVLKALAPSSSSRTARAAPKAGRS
jgi:3-methyladenine DNA glycosylase AlkD